MQQQMQQRQLQLLQHQQQTRQALMAQQMYQGMGPNQMGVPISQAQAAQMAAMGRRMPVASPLQLQQAQYAQHQQGQPMNVRQPEPQ
jgi:hypothetical protein